MLHPETRRRFLKGLAGGAAALPMLPSHALSRSLHETMRAGERLPVADSDSEPYWRLVRNQFVIKPGYVMLNAANLCPSPHTVREVVVRLTDDLDGDVSFQSRAKFDNLREEARLKLATLMGATADEIAIVRNTSEANNVIVSGLSLKTGDEVIVFDENHPSNNVAWDVRASRFGFTVKRLTLRKPPESTEEILTLVRGAMSAKTKVLAFSDASNVSGLRMPTKELCLMARERGIYTHIDGAQTFGSLVVSLRDLGCDSYSGSAHKWFLGPKEAGLLYVRRERIPEIWPGVISSGWGDRAETAAKGARKFETLGQRDDAAVSAVGTTVDFHNLIGPVRIESRVRELSRVLKDGLVRIPGAKLKTSMMPELSAGVCVVTFEGKDTQAIYEALYAKHRIAGAPSGGVRFCPHIYNTMDEITRTIAAVDQVVRAL